MSNLALRAAANVDMDELFHGQLPLLPAVYPFKFTEDEFMAGGFV